MKEKIERTMSNASGKRVTSTLRQDNVGNTEQRTPPPEEKRRQKAQEWMKKVQVWDEQDKPRSTPHVHN